VNVVLHTERLDSDNAMEIFAPYDLDRGRHGQLRPPATWFNDAAVLLGKPYVWGSIYRFDGQASVFWAEHGPCYRLPVPGRRRPAWCRPAPRAVSSACCARPIGSIQVNEAIRSSPGSASRWSAG